MSMNEAKKHTWQKRNLMKMYQTLSHEGTRLRRVIPYYGIDNGEDIFGRIIATYMTLRSCGVRLRRF